MKEDKHSVEYLRKRAQEMQSFTEIMSSDAQEILQKAIEANDPNIVCTYTSALLAVCSELLCRSIGRQRMYESFMLAAIGPDVVMDVADTQRMMEKATGKKGN